jgi:hypothetical protein
MKKLSIYQTARSVFFMLAVFMSSCKQDLTVQPNSIIDKTTTDKVVGLRLENVDVVDGRLAFKSNKDLQAAYEKMFKNQKNLDDFETQFKGFTSQKQAYENFTEEDLQQNNGDLTPFQDYITKEVRDGEVFYERVVSPKLYALLVNSEGLLQIKDSVYKFVPGLVYAFDVNDMPSYRANKNNLKAIKNVQTINFEVKKQKIEVATRGILQEVESAQRTDFYEKTKSGTLVRRVDAFLKTPNPCCFFAWGAEVAIEHKKRGFLGGWYSESTGMNISGTVTFGVINPFGGREINPNCPITINDAANTSYLEELLDYNYAGFEYLYFSPTNLTFTALRKTGGNSVQTILF